MPFRNRVDPWGQLIETPARGAWFGNRGCVHDDRGRITERKPPTDAWIICLLEFKGRRRPLLQPGRFTELFFLDEATALAAGHRPCGECRLEALRLFGSLWPHKRVRAEHALAPEIDAVLARERADDSDPARIIQVDDSRLPPDGVMLSFMDDAEDEALLCARGAFWRWTPAGYEGPVRAKGVREALMLTPPSTARTIANGYRPQIHSSAMR